MNKFCCEDFKDMFDEDIIEEDRGIARSRGWYTREKYVIKCSNGYEAMAHIYMKFCPRCGSSLVSKGSD
jgi:rRNA maturation endonuclease Nob1